MIGICAAGISVGVAVGVGVGVSEGTGLGVALGTGVAVLVALGVSEGTAVADGAWVGLGRVVCVCPVQDDNKIAANDSR